MAIIRGTALAPGVSRNGRLYTREAIAKAFNRAAARITDPDGLPIVMRTHHDAGDDSTRVVARVRNVSLDTAGRLLFEAVPAETQTARDILANTDNKALRVSVFGNWVGKKRRELHDGQLVETADDLEIDAIDFTWKPGVVEAKAAVESDTDTHPNRITETVEAVLEADDNDMESDVMAAPAEPADDDAPTYASFTVASGAWQVTVSQNEDYDGDVDINPDQLRAAVEAAVAALTQTPDSTESAHVKEPQVAESTEPVAEATAPTDDALVAKIVEALTPLLTAKVSETAVETTTDPEPVTEDHAPADMAALRESLKAEILAELVKEGHTKPARKGHGLAETTESEPDNAEAWAKRGDAYAAAFGLIDPDQVA